MSSQLTPKSESKDEQWKKSWKSKERMKAQH